MVVCPRERLCPPAVHVCVVLHYKEQHQLVAQHDNYVIFIDFENVKL